MKKLLRAFGLIFGVGAPLLAAPTSPPAGNYIQNVSTNAANQIFKVSSGTITGQLLVGSCGIIGGGSCGSGGTGGSGIVSPGTFTWQNTQGITVSTLTANNKVLISAPMGQNTDALDVVMIDTTNGWNAQTITSTGTGNPLRIYSHGKPSNAVQFKTAGALNVQLSSFDPIQDGIVVYSSQTDSQGGAGLMRLWADNSGWNDPLLWIKKAANNSAPGIRINEIGETGIEMYDDSYANEQGGFKIASNNQSLELEGRNQTDSAFVPIIVMYGTSSVSDPYHTYIETGGKLSWMDINNNHSVGFQASNSMSGSQVWVLPTGDGMNGQAITTNGSGQLSFMTVGGGGSNGSIVASTQTNVTYYSGVATNTVSGAAGFTWNGTTVAAPAISIAGGNVAISSGIRLNGVSSTTLSGLTSGTGTMWYDSSNNAMELINNGQGDPGIILVTTVSIPVGHLVAMGNQTKLVDGGASGSGGVTGQINSSPQYQVGQFSVSGSSNVITGSPDLTVQAGVGVIASTISVSSLTVNGPSTFGNGGSSPLSVNLQPNNHTNGSVLLYGAASTNGDANFDYYSDPSTFYERLRMTNQNLGSGSTEHRYHSGWNFEDQNGSVKVYIPRTGGIVVNSTGSFTLYDGPTAHYVSFVASNTIASNLSFVLPATDGTNGQCLATDGNKNLSFQTVSSVGGGSSTTTVQINGTPLTAITTTFNFIPGAGILITGSTPTANQANLTLSPDTTVLQTQSQAQTGYAINCNGFLTGMQYQCILSVTGSLQFTDANNNPMRMTFCPNASWAGGPVTLTNGLAAKYILVNGTNPVQGIITANQCGYVIYNSTEEAGTGAWDWTGMAGQALLSSTETFTAPQTFANITINGTCTGSGCGGTGSGGGVITPSTFTWPGVIASSVQIANPSSVTPYILSAGTTTAPGTQATGVFVSTNGSTGVGTTNLAGNFFVVNAPASYPGNSPLVEFLYNGSNYYEFDDNGSATFFNSLHVPIVYDASTWELASGSNGLLLASNLGVRFSNSTAYNSTVDLGFNRHSATTAELNNGTMGQYSSLILSTMSVVASTSAVYEAVFSTSQTPGSQSIAISTNAEIVVNGSTGTSNQVLTSQGPGLPVKWASGGAGSVTNVSGINGILVTNNTTTPVVSVSSVSLSSQTVGTLSLTTQAGGTLQAAQEPAHTGDVTNSAGSLAMTAAALQSNITTMGASSVTINGSELLKSTVTVAYSTMIINGVEYSFPSTGTTGGFLQYIATNTLQWATPAGGTTGGGGGVTVPSSFTWTGVIASSIQIANPSSASTYILAAATTTTPGINSQTLGLFVSTNSNTGIGTTNLSNSFLTVNAPSSYPGNSPLVEFNYNGSNYFEFDDNGAFTVNSNGGITSPSFSDASTFELKATGYNGLVLADNLGLRFTNSTAYNSAIDAGIFRNALGVIEVDNGTQGTLATLVASTMSVGSATLTVPTQFQVIASTPETYAAYVATATTGAYGVSVTTTNHVNFGGAAPAAGTCGTSPHMGPNSSDMAGTIAWGGAATTCAFTFSQPFKNAPFCLANTAGASYTEDAGVTSSSATFTFSSSLTGSTMTYICHGGSGG